MAGALHLCSVWYDIVILGDLSRNNISKELEANSLAPVVAMYIRLSARKGLTGKVAGFQNFNIAAKYKGRCNRSKIQSTSLWRAQY